MNKSLINFLALICLAFTVAVNGRDQSKTVKGRMDSVSDLANENSYKQPPPRAGTKKDFPTDKSETPSDADRESDDEVVLSRLDLAKLSGTRADLARLGHNQALPVETKCKTYADLLHQMLGDRAASDERDLFSQVVRVLGRRKLPFGNSQPVLTDLQECLNSSPLPVESSNPKREVIASPPERKREEEPSSAQKGMERAIGEFKEVKNNVKDYGQDIYLPDKNQPSLGTDSVPSSNMKPQGGEIDHDAATQHSNEPEEHNEDSHQYPGDHTGDTDSTDEYSEDSFTDEVHPESGHMPENDDPRRGAYSYAHSSAVTNSDGKSVVAYEVSSTDPQGVTNTVARKYRKELENHPSEADNDANSLESELDESYREIFDLRNRVTELELIAERATTEAAQAKEALQSAAPGQSNPSIDRARAETYRLQYEAVAQREVELLKELNEYRAKAAAQESHSVDNSGNPDNDYDDEYELDSGPTNLNEVASKMAHKLDFNEDPVKRCARYYLLLSYPKKIDKYVIKTVARLKVPSIQPPDADYQDVLRHAANSLMQSSKKKAILVGNDIQQCLARASQGDFTRKGFSNSNSYSYGSVRQSVPVFRVPPAPITPIPPIPPIPPFQPGPDRYWGAH